jgi:hypothetical protein
LHYDQKIGARTGRRIALTIAERHADPGFLNDLLKTPRRNARNAKRTELKRTLSKRIVIMQSAAPIPRADAQFVNQSTDSKPPSTCEKERSSTIANRLGIHSTAPVIDGFESIEKWIEHRDTVVAELNPVGKLETAHAERAALYLWRLDRVVRFENIATQFDLDELTAEFIVSLDHPELPRDRSEAVTLEKIRAPLGEFLKQFEKWGDVAAKLPGQKEGMADVRGELKRIKERRIIPDQPTIQTIIKYEAHLDRCLARTMTELRRLQKERRQGLRTVADDRIANEPASGVNCAQQSGICPTKRRRGNRAGGSEKPFNESGSNDESISRKIPDPGFVHRGGRGDDRAGGSENQFNESGSQDGSISRIDSHIEIESPNRDQDLFKYEDGSPGGSPSQSGSPSHSDLSNQDSFKYEDGSPGGSPSQEGSPSHSDLSNHDSFKYEDGSPGGSPSQEGSPSQSGSTSQRRAMSHSDLSNQDSFKYEDGSPGGSPSQSGSPSHSDLSNQDSFKYEDGSPGGSPSQSGSTSQRGAIGPIESHIQSESRVQSESTTKIDPPIQNPPPQHKPESKNSLISESTPEGIVTRERNASGVTITMFPQTHYSANPNVIVPQPPVTIAPIQRR